MAKKEIMIIADYSQSSEISLEELCEICGISPEILDEMLEYQIVFPEGESPEEFVFDMIQLQRAKTALRLQRDLEVNFAGTAIILDMLEELEALRARTELLEKHLLKVINHTKE